MLSSGMQFYHLELMLSSGTTCFHLGWNVIIWDAMLSSGANVIIWDEMLSSGANVIMVSSGANVIIWCYHVMLSSGMITHPFFIFPENFTHSNSRSLLHFWSRKCRLKNVQHSLRFCFVPLLSLIAISYSSCVIYFMFMKSHLIISPS